MYHFKAFNVINLHPFENPVGNILAVLQIDIIAELNSWICRLWVSIGKYLLVDDLQGIARNGNATLDIIIPFVNRSDCNIKIIPNLLPGRL
jgi:hypothetical protein